MCGFAIIWMRALSRVWDCISFEFSGQVCRARSWCVWRVFEVERISLIVELAVDYLNMRYGGAYGR